MLPVLSLCFRHYVSTDRANSKSLQLEDNKLKTAEGKGRILSMLNLPMHLDTHYLLT